MAKKIRTAIEIRADRETVWSILTDFEKYPEWNPFIKSVTGEMKVGSRIKIRLQGMAFKPVILTYDKNSEIKWLGSLFFKGLFDGEHRFKLTEIKEGTTLFEQSEKFMGLLVPLFAKSLDTDTKQGFQQMNEKLGQIAEEAYLSKMD